VSNSLELNKAKTALVVIDLQKGIASFPSAPHDTKTVVSNAAKIADLFRENKMPVFLVRVAMTDAERLKPIADEQSPMRGPSLKEWSDIMPELGPKEADIVITKKQWGAFFGTELDLQLRRRGIDTIVLCGIATNIGVESTARFAYEYGYNQVFVEDACAGNSSELHNMAMNSIFKRIGRVRTTEEVLRALLDATT
jgi:nicotinamidase-related amidase